MGHEGQAGRGDGLYEYQITGSIAWTAWPSVALLVTFLGVRRSWGLWRTLGVVTLGTYAVWMASVGFFPLHFGEGESALGVWRESLNLVPLRTLIDSFGDGSGTAYLVRVHGGNLLLLAPFTLLGAVMWPRMRRWWKALLVGVGGSLAIELTQLALRVVSHPPYRSVDVDDVILNTAGALLGYGVYVVGRGLLSRRRAARQADVLLPDRDA